jgi:uncharacterized cupin superfamily protein
MSARRHCHAKEDELNYRLEGEPILTINAGETTMTPADCAGFKGGSGDVVCLEIGDHTPGNTVVSRDHDSETAMTAVALLA